MPFDLFSGLDKKKSGSLQERIETERLFRTVLKQQHKVGALQGGTGDLMGKGSMNLMGQAETSGVKQKPSLLNRIFDVISRPVYATTGFATERVKDVFGDVKKGNILGAVLNGISPPDADELKAVGKGFWGTRKESFSDTLKAAGVDNKFALGAGGLIGDILLDPTTYLTMGATAAVKGGLKAGAKGIIEEGTEAFASKIVKEAGEKAALEAGAKAVKEGLHVKDTKRLVKAARKEAEHSHAYDILQKSKKAIEGSEAAKFQIKMMGKPIWQSETIPRMASSVGAKIGERPTAQHFKKLFSTKATLPEEVKFVKDMVQGQTYNNLDLKIKEIKTVFDGTTPEQRRSIAHAIEHGTIDKLDDILRPKAEWAKGQFDDWAHTETVAIGALKPDQKLNNYVYHYIIGRDAGKLKSIKRKIAGTENPSFAKKRIYGTIEEVKEAISKGHLKATVDDDIASILFHRARKHGEVSNRKAFVDQIVGRFGVPIDKSSRKAAQLAKNQGLLKKSKSPFVPKDQLFDPEIANAIDKVDDIILNDKSVGHFLKMFDKVQNFWKFSTTVPNPGFHVRNVMGDTWNAYLDGVVNPARYRDGYRLAAKMANPGMGGDISRMRYKIGKVFLNGEEMLGRYRDVGLKSGFTAAEYGHDAVGAGRILQKVEHVGRGVSEVREDGARLAHFIDAMIKEGKGIKSVDELIGVSERAARRVKKFHFDYNDLTDFEKKVMRRAVPFYTWMRKNIPLQLEMLATKPGRVAVLPKGLHALQEMLGIETEDPNAPLSGIDRIIPKWLQEMAGVQIGETGEGTPRVFAPQLPIQDLTRLIEGDSSKIMQNVLASLSPMARAPMEIAAGKQFFTGQPITSLPAYFAGQLPQTRGLTQLDQVSSGKRSPLDVLLSSLGVSPSRLAGVYDVTRSQQRGELRRIQDPLEAIIAELNRKREAQGYNLGG